MNISMRERNKVMDIYYIVKSKSLIYIQQVGVFKHYHN